MRENSTAVPGTVSGGGMLETFREPEFRQAARQVLAHGHLAAPAAGGHVKPIHEALETAGPGIDRVENGAVADRIADAHVHGRSLALGNQYPKGSCECE